MPKHIWHKFLTVKSVPERGAGMHPSLAYAFSGVDYSIPGNAVSASGLVGGLPPVASEEMSYGTLSV